MEQTYMKEKPVLQLVLSMSLPMILSMMVSSLYNIIDSFFVAKISEKAMTALSLVYPVQNLVNAVTIGFGVGMNAVIAFYLGAQDQKKANATAIQGTLLSVLHGLVLTVGCIAVMPVFLRSFTSDEETIRLGLQYANIVFGFAMIIALDLAFEKLFQAVGQMTVAMVSMLSGCIANILLDPILIFGLGPAPALGIQGGGHCHGSRAGHYADRLSSFLLSPPSSGQAPLQRSALGLASDRKIVFHRHPGHIESGPALRPDFCPERNPCRLLPGICAGTGNLL